MFKLKSVLSQEALLKYYYAPNPYLLSVLSFLGFPSYSDKLNTPQNKAVSCEQRQALGQRLTILSQIQYYFKTSRLYKYEVAKLMYGFLHKSLLIS